MSTSLWNDVRQWAQDEDVDIAVGEWGVFGTDKAAGQHVHEWYEAAVNSHRDGKGARVVALAAFDSPNEWYQGNWQLKGEQLVAFHDIMAAEANTSRPTTTTTTPSTTTTPPAASTTTTPPAASIAGATPGSSPAPGTWFVDDNGSVHESDIELIAAAGITSGCNPPTNSRYCPGSAVSRGQMAALLRRALDLRVTSRNFFSDDAGSIFEGDINRFAAAGITTGCNPPTNSRYCPDATVSRGQMAAFLVRALDLPSTSRDFFSDDTGTLFEDDINRLAAAGITSGCNPPANNRYCPDSSVSRGQMATFLARGLDL